MAQTRTSQGSLEELATLSLFDWLLQWPSKVWWCIGPSQAAPPIGLLGRPDQPDTLVGLDCTDRVGRVLVATARWYGLEDVALFAWKVS